jgi:O-antigen biosynthesis protein WbqP
VAPVAVSSLTGWAQVNGRDEISIEAKVQFDAEYLRDRSAPTSHPPHVTRR